MRFTIQSFMLLPLIAAGQSIRAPAIHPPANWTAPARVKRARAQVRAVKEPQIQLAGTLAEDPLIFVPIEPCRLADTRSGSAYPALGLTPLAKYVARTLPVWGLCGISGSASPEAYSLSVTVVPASGTAGGYLLVYPNPISPAPVAASFTWNPNQLYQSGSVVAVPSVDGSINFIVSTNTNVVVDINGYYAPPTNVRSDTAMGIGALSSDATGSDNTAFGTGALLANINGSSNTGLGYAALYSANGNDNTAVGFAALYASTGSRNVAVGSNAGSSLSAGSDNIMIGSQGVSTDDHTIRIGDLQTSTHIAGVWGAAIPSGASVVVNSQGQLGVQPSSRRYKEDIQDMGDQSRNLLQLRPVTFRYKTPNADGTKPLEFGLIAEEVAEVYPELVVKGEDGQADAVEYSKLPAMLLNEFQRETQHAEQRAEQQDKVIRQLEARILALETQVSNSAVRTPSAKGSAADPAK